MRSLRPFLRYHSRGRKSENYLEEIDVSKRMKRKLDVLFRDDTIKGIILEVMRLFHQTSSKFERLYVDTVGRLFRCTLDSS